MSGEETVFDYRVEVDRMLLAVRFLADVNVDGIIKAVADAHNVAWFIDPTAYQRALASGDMDAIAAVAKAVRDVARVYREKIAPKLPETVA